MLKITDKQIIKKFDKGPLRRSFFSNGSTSIFHRAKGFSGAKVCFNFIAGSVFEKQNEYGIAHLIEHLIFKENKSEYLKQLEYLGAEVNAFTDKENVCFEMDCLAEKLDIFLPLFCNLIMSLDFSANQFRNEKKVVIQELREDLDDFETFGIEYALKSSLGPAFGHPVGGSITNIKQIKIDDVLNYYKKMFKPSRLIVTVVSGKEFDKLEDILKCEFSKNYSYKSAKPFRIKAVSNLKNITKYKKSLKKRMENSILILNLPAPSLKNRKYYDLAILDQVLFDGLTSVFFKELREKTPLVYSLGSSIYSFNRSGCYLMIFTTQNSEFKNLKNKVLEILYSFTKKKLDTNLVEQIKSNIMDSLDLSFDSLDERASFLSNDEIYSLNELSSEEIKKNISKTSSQTIIDTWNEIIKNGISELLLESAKKD